MANIKISELNALTEKEDSDLLAIVDTSTEETKKIQVSDLLDKNIELIAVSDTAPSQCSVGDKYYNTTDKEIYTATDTNTWSETGTTPISGILYIVYNEQASYSWDGTDLVSVGGGKEDIVIDDEEPTDPDVKLWIDTGEIGSQTSEITDEYSTSTKKGYSANYINYMVEIPISINIFDSTNAKANYYLNNDGTEGQSSNFSYTDYIEIESGKEYIVSAYTSSMGNNPAICFYNSSKTFISGVAYDGNSTKKFTTPENCKYVRVSYRTANETNTTLVNFDERIIGKINGKNLYKRILTFKTPDTTTDGNDVKAQVYIAPNIEMSFVEWSGICMNDNSIIGSMRQLPFISTNGYRVHLTTGTSSSGTVGTSANYLSVSNGYSGYTNSNYIVASVIYTKSTD